MGSISVGATRAAGQCGWEGSSRRQPTYLLKLMALLDEAPAPPPPVLCDVSCPNWGENEGDPDRGFCPTSSDEAMSTSIEPGRSVSERGLQC